MHREDNRQKARVCRRQAGAWHARGGTVNSLSGDKAGPRKEKRLHKQFEFIRLSLKPTIFFCCICQTAVLQSTVWIHRDWLDETLVRLTLMPSYEPLRFGQTPNKETHGMARGQTSELAERNRMCLCKKKTELGVMTEGNVSLPKGTSATVWSILGCVDNRKPRQRLATNILLSKNRPERSRADGTQLSRVT